MRKIAGAIALSLLAGVPARASDPAPYDAAAGWGCSAELVRTLDCDPWATADADGSAHLHIDLAGRVGGLLPGDGFAFARGTMWATDVLPAPTESATYTVALDVEHATVERTGLLGSGGAAVTASLSLHHGGCGCFAWNDESIVSTTAGGAAVEGDTVTVTSTLVDPDGDLLPAGDVWLTITLYGSAAIENGNGTARLDAELRATTISGPAA